MKPMELIEQGRFLGEEFLLWLWMRGLTEGGTSGIEGDQSALFLDDAVVLVTERGDCKSVSLSKGNPAESREAFEAISRGFRPAKAKIRLLSGDMEWVFTLASGALQLSGMKLPPTQSKDLQGRVADRLFLIEEGLAHLDRRFAEFLNLRTRDPEGLQDHFKAWITAGLEGLGADEPAPWEKDGAAPAQGSAHDRDITVSVSTDGENFTKPIAMSDFKSHVGAVLKSIVGAERVREGDQ